MNVVIRDDEIRSKMSGIIVTEGLQKAATPQSVVRIVKENTGIDVVARVNPETKDLEVKRVLLN